MLNTNPSPFPIAIVVGHFNSDITTQLLRGAESKLKRLGFLESDIHVAWVPGAVELPLAAQAIAQTKTVEAIITLGAVIQGETDHYDYVCQMVSRGCLDVMLKYDIPVIFGVLTAQTEEQAHARVGGDAGHKGEEAVEAAIQMITTLRQIRMWGRNGHV